MLKLGKEKVTWTIATFVIQERPAHIRTWNLKAALGPKPCKVKQQYQHTKVNQINMCSPKRFVIILIRLKFLH